MSRKNTRGNKRHMLRNLLLWAEILFVSLVIIGGSRFSADEKMVPQEHVREQEQLKQEVSQMDETAVPEFSWKNYKAIAHALGGLDEKSYLNSRESFIHSYEKGIRLFEVDLTQTSDGVWVCRHNWHQSLGQWQGEEKRVLTAKEFLTRPIYGKYTPMSFEDLLVLLKEYPDAYVLIDSKQYSIRNYMRTLDDYSEYVKIAQNAGAEKVLGQLIPEIYNNAMFSGTALLYNFPSYIYSLWQEYSGSELKEIAAFCKEKKIPAVTVSAQYWTAEVQKIFDEQGILVYIYTVNEQDAAMDFLKKGAFGICSDTLSEKELLMD